MGNDAVAFNPALIVLLAISAVSATVTYRKSRDWRRAGLSVVAVFGGFIVFSVVLHLLGFE